MLLGRRCFTCKYEIIDRNRPEKLRATKAANEWKDNVFSLRFVFILGRLTGFKFTLRFRTVEARQVLYNEMNRTRQAGSWTYSNKQKRLHASILYSYSHWSFLLWFTRSTIPSVISQARSSLGGYVRGDISLNQWRMPITIQFHKKYSPTETDFASDNNM